MNLTPDYSLFAQLGIFLALLASLHFLLFKPALRVIERRRKATESQSADLVLLHQRAEQLLAQCEARLGEARAKGIAIKEELRRQGEIEVGRIVEQAKDSSEKFVRQMRATLAQEGEAARVELSQKVETLSQQLTEQLLGRTLH